ncbi:hypothetical protein FB451DRAFT_1162388 [Mycena latifolia]|nr:hypothetical protein FB451DRAFT_1162388 [Mycena latifolia]
MTESKLERLFAARSPLSVAGVRAVITIFERWQAERWRTFFFPPSSPPSRPRIAGASQWILAEQYEKVDVFADASQSRRSIDGDMSNNRSPVKNFQPQKKNVFPAVAQQNVRQQVAHPEGRMWRASSAKNARRKSVSVPLVAATNEGRPTTYLFPGTKSKDLNPKQPFSKATVSLPNGGVAPCVYEPGKGGAGWYYKPTQGFAPSPKK